MKHLIAIALFAGASAFSVSPVHAATVEIESEGPVIELSVFESVDVEPDRATIGAGVTSEAPTAVEALRLNSRQMRQVIDRIKALGIDEKDIQTSGISLSPRWDYNPTDNRPIFRGYSVSNRVAVILRKIEDTGRVLDELVAAGATDLSGPTFSIEDDTAAKDEARKRALERAGKRAREYAAIMGYDGVRVLEISEAITGHGPLPPVVTRNVSALATAEQSAPVQPGRVATGVQIRITYEMTGG